MKRLVKKNSFKILLFENTTKATACLIREILKLVATERKVCSLFRTLHYTRFQLQIIHASTGLTVEMGENVSELLFVIDTELKLLDMRLHGLFPAPQKSVSNLRWTGKATDLVELLYALDTCDCINNGEIGVEELADALSEIFGVEIKNCYNVYMNMKHRKDDSRTYFLDELREKLNKRMVESDLKGGKFKKR